MGQHDLMLLFAKNILIVGETDFLETKVRKRLALAGARIIGPLDVFAEVQLSVGLFRIDAVVIDVTLDAEAIMELVQLLDHFKIEYVFASINAGRVHPDQFVLSSQIADLADIARALFRPSTCAVTIH